MCWYCILWKEFRVALHRGEDDNIVVLVDSGSYLILRSNFKACIYVHMNDNPFDLTREEYTTMRVHLSTYILLEEKRVLDIVDRFGWCEEIYIYIYICGVLETIPSCGIQSFQSFSVVTCDIAYCQRQIKSFSFI